MDWDGIFRWGRRWEGIRVKLGPVYLPELAGKTPAQKWRDAWDEGWDL